MSKKEIYRLEVKLGVDGDGQVKKKLSAMDKFIEKTEKRLKNMDKIKVNPSAKLNDKASSPAEKIEKKIKNVDKAKANPTVKLKDKASDPLSRIQKKIGAFSKFAIGKLAAVTAAGLVMVGGFGLKDTIQTFADFEQGMKNVQATSMATDSDLARMTETAKRLGATTSFSAIQASEGMNYLAMA